MLGSSWPFAKGFIATWRKTVLQSTTEILAIKRLPKRAKPKSWLNSAMQRRMLQLQTKTFGAHAENAAQELLTMQWDCAPAANHKRSHCVKHYRVFKEMDMPMSEAILKLEFISSIGGFEHFNREISPSHVREIGSQVIKDGGLIRRVVVVKTTSFGDKERLVVVDGQHLCKYLISVDNDVIPIIVIEMEGLFQIWQRMVAWNNSSKKWGDIQYVLSGAACGLEDYKNLLTSVLQTYPLIQLSLQVTELMGASSRSGAMKTMKEGRFHTKSEAELGALQNFEDITICAEKITPGGQKPPRQLIEALMRLAHSDDYSRDAMLEMANIVNGSNYVIPSGDYNDVLKSLFPYYNIARGK
jgi:hypothetical protein